MHKLRNEILFLQLEDSNYMLGKIEAVQTVTCYLCKVNFTSGRIPEFYFNILQRFSSIPSAEDIRFFLQPLPKIGTCINTCLEDLRLFLKSLVELHLDYNLLLRICPERKLPG